MVLSPVIAGFLLGMALGGPAPAQDPPEVETLIRQLGADRIEEREEAAHRLLSLGKRGRAAVERATHDADPDRSARARAALDRIDRLPECLLDSLARSATAHGTDYQRLLRDLSIWFAEACEKKDWGPFEFALKSARCERTEMSRFFAGPEELKRREVRYRYVLLKDGFTTPSGLRHELYAEFYIRIHVDPLKRTRFEIQDTEIGLCARFGQPLKDVQKRAPYPRDSVLDLFLRKEDGFDSASKLPILDSLEIHYGLIYDRWVEEHPRGFHMVITTLSEGGDQGFSSRYTVASGLDPLERRDGTKLTEGFKSENTLGGIDSMRGMGGHGWGGPSPMRVWTLVRKGAKDLPASKEAEYSGATAYSVPDIEALPADTRELIVDKPDFRDDELACAARLMKLSYLGLGYCERLAGQGLEHIGRLSGLASLTLAGKSLEDEELRHLAGLSALQRLWIFDDNRLGHAGFRHVGRAAWLESFRATGCRNLTDRCLEELSALSHLKELEIGGRYDSPGDWGLKSLEKAKALERLEVWYPGRALPEDMAGLARLPSLRDLELCAPAMTDQALAELGSSKSLIRIELLYAKEITRAGLAPLLRIPGLARLRVYDCKKVTQVDIEALIASSRGEFILR
jgi:hypothetical protein